MIIAKPKPMDEIIGTIKDFKKILVAGCNGCVAVCEAGGLKEAEVVASALRIYFTQRGERREIEELSITRQCDKEYLQQLREHIESHDAVLSLACGAGVQYLAEIYPDKPIFPGVDTCFIGVNVDQGVWSERCQACGQCVLASTGGICPIARCSKRMLNGPCGGTENGKCEISILVGRDIPCGWNLIFERLKKLGQLQRFREPFSDKDWLQSRDGGPREIIREDVRP
jgi:ferredoxin